MTNTKARARWDMQQRSVNVVILACVVESDVSRVKLVPATLNFFPRRLDGVIVYVVDSDGG